MYDDLVPRIKESARERKGFCKIHDDQAWVNTVEFLQGERVVVTVIGLPRDRLKPLATLLLLGIHADGILQISDSYVETQKMEEGESMKIPKRGSLGQRFQSGDPSVFESIAVCAVNEAGYIGLATFPYVDATEGLTWKEDHEFSEFAVGGGEIPSELLQAFALSKKLQVDEEYWIAMIGLMLMDTGASIAVWEDCIKFKDAFPKPEDGDVLLMTSNQEVQTLGREMTFLRI